MDYAIFNWKRVAEDASTLYGICERVANGRSLDGDRKNLVSLGEAITHFSGEGRHPDLTNVCEGIVSSPETLLALKSISKDYFPETQTEGVDSFGYVGKVLRISGDKDFFKKCKSQLLKMFEGLETLAEMNSS